MRQIKKLIAIPIKNTVVILAVAAIVSAVFAAVHNYVVRTVCNLQFEGCRPRGILQGIIVRVTADFTTLSMYLVELLLVLLIAQLVWRSVLLLKK